MPVIETPRPFIVPGLAKASPAERASLDEKTSRERGWYKDHMRFNDAMSIAAGARLGRLAFVGVDDNILPPARYRNPANVHRFPPYLLPGSREAMKAIGRLWRREITELEINEPRLRLSLTCLIRSVAMNNALVQNSDKLVSADSTHCVGAAFDIDASGYFILGEDAVPQKVSHPDRDLAAIAVIQRVLETVSPAPATVEADVPYEALVTASLVNVTDRLHADGMINRILEFPGTSNQCVHVAPNPEIEAVEWQSIAS